MDIATLVVVGLVIITALTFDFTNGFHDTANAMATSIATGALKPKTAVIAAGTLNLVGAFLSTEVAKTISGGIINEQAVTIGPEFIFAGLVGAIIWNLLTWLVGLPSSSSHALFGGLVGAVIIGAGIEGVNFGAVLAKVLIPALVSPIVAGLAAFVAVKLIYFIVKKMSEDQIVNGFRHGQTVTACLVALSHGTNDAQKTMGIITLTLIAVGAQGAGTGPQLWVVAVCGLAIAAGTYMGGWRVIRTLGKGLTEISTPQASPPRLLPQPRSSFLLTWLRSFLPRGVLRLHHRYRLGKPGNKVNWGVAGSYACRMARYFPGCRPCGRCGVRTRRKLALAERAVAFIAVGAALVIFRLSKRNPVNSGNVNESSEVKIKASTSTKVATAA